MVLTETGRFVLLWLVLLFYTGTFNWDTHIPSACLSSLCLGALFGQTVTCGDWQDSVLASRAVGTEDGDSEGLCLHGSTAHTLLLHSGLVQGVHGLAAAFALMDGQMDSTTGREKGWDGEGQCYDFTELCRLIHLLIICTNMCVRDCVFTWSLKWAFSLQEMRLCKVPEGTTCVHVCAVSHLTVVQFYLLLWLAVVHFDEVKSSHCPPTLRLRTFE